MQVRAKSDEFSAAIVRGFFVLLIYSMVFELSEGNSIVLSVGHREVKKQVNDMTLGAQFSSN